MSTPSILINDINRIVLTWNPPSDDGGSPILGYYIKMKKNSESEYITVYDGSNILTHTATIYEYNNNELEYTTYDFQIFAINIIVALFDNSFTENSDNSPSFSVTISNSPYYSNCILSGNGLTEHNSDGSDYNVIIKSYDKNGNELNSDGGIFLLDIRDYCELVYSDNGYSICQRISSDSNSEYYNNDIFKDKNDYIKEIFTDNNDGTYSANYNLIANGYITLTLFQLFNGGLRGQYYDNVWFNEPPSLTQIDNNINFNWNGETIFNSYSDFISIRWIGALLSPFDGLCTFTIYSDDGVRIYIDNNLLLDNINNVCDSCIFTYNLEKGNYYNIRIDYIQKQVQSKIMLYWKSSSLARQIISEEYFFYYEKVPESSYTIKLSSDELYSSYCYIKNIISEMKVGKKYTLYIIPVDIQGNILTNIEESTSIIFYSYLINDDTSITKGNLYIKSIFDYDNQYFILEYIPTIIGTYKLYIILNDINIKNIPLSITVNIGDVSSSYSTISDITFPYTSNAGINVEFTLNLYDSMGNKFTSEPTSSPNIKIIAEWDNNSDNYKSPLNLDSYYDTSNGFSYSGTYSSNNDGTYKLSYSILMAGDYNLYIYINNIKLNDCPYSITIIPTMIDADRCIYNTLSDTNLIAGNSFNIQYQCKDNYYNFLQQTLSDFDSYVIKARLNDSNYNTENEIYVEGTITDIENAIGCFDISLTLKKSGNYLTYFLINDIQIPQIELKVTPNNANYKYSSVQINNFKSNYIVGEYFIINITSYDEYENLVYDDTSSNYIIKLYSTIDTSDNNKFNGKSYNAISCENGTYYYNLTITTVDNYYINIYLNDENSEILNSPINNIIYTYSIASYNSKISTYISDDLIAGSKNNIFKAIAYDIYGNIVKKKQNEVMYLELINKNNESINYTYIATYNLDTSTYENYYFDINNVTIIGEYSINLKILNNFGLMGFYYQNVDFHNLLNKVNLNYHNSIYNNKYYYTRIDETINFNINYDTLIENYPSKLFSIKWKGYIKSTYSEIYTITLEVIGKVILYIDNNLAINYNSNNEDTDTTLTKNYVNIYLNKNKYIPITLYYIKEEDVLITKLIMYWESDNTIKEIIPQDNLYSEVYNENEYSLNFINTDTYPYYTTIITSNYNNQCLLNNENSFNFYLYDTYNNIQKLNKDTISINFINNDDTSITFSGNVNYDSDNYYYICTYTITTSGNYTLYITINNIIINSFEIFYCSTTSESLNIDYSNILIEGDYEKNIAGNYGIILITLYDSNNGIISSGDNIIFDIDIYNNDKSITISDIINSFNNTLNKFNITYITTSADTFTIEIKVNDNSIYSGTLTISHNITSNIKSIYSNINSYINNFGTEYNFNIILKDYYNNLISDEDYVIYSYVNGYFGINKNYVTQDSSDKSLYSITYTLNRYNDTYSGCGIAKLISYALLNNGINIYYYDNYYLSGDYTDYIIYTDELNYILKNSQLIFDKYDKLYKSLQFSFYFYPLYTETYYFIISNKKYNDFKFLIDDNLLIITFTLEDNDQYICSISLTTYKYYNIRINLYIESNIVNLKVTYYSESQTLKTINYNSNNDIYYALDYDTPINNNEINLNTYSPPSKITSFSEGDKLTYSSTNITLIWSEPNDNGCSSITNYKILKYDISLDDNTYNELVTLDNIYTFTDTDITNGKSYNYKILAINQIGEGIESEILTLSAIGLCSAPLNLKIVISSNDDNYLYISWEIPSNTVQGDSTTYPINKYVLEIYDNNLNTNEYNIIYSGENLYYNYNIKNNIIYGHTYNFRVYAITERGNGEYSEIVQYIYSTIPDKPISPPVVNSENTNSEQITISYLPITENNGADITQYNIYVNEDYENPINNGLNLRLTYTKDI